MSHDSDRPNIARLPHPGEVIDGRYRLEETFASGGMGVIMRAEQLRTGRDVAVKLLHPHIASRSDFAARFMREVKVATLFDHPHIVRVYDVGETEQGGLYLVMELLEGEELKDIIKREAPLSTGRVMRLGMQILDGLGEAHSREVIHRDLKPSNVFVTTTRRGKESVKLLDFGIAKLVNSGDQQVTATGSFTGTPSYMAPETMFETEKVNKRAADVYAAGLLLLEMLTGRRVFDGQVLAQTLLQHLKKPVLIPEVIAETPLGEVIERSTQKHPDDRYADGDEMFSALEDACGDTPDDICLDAGEIPGPAPETSPSLLDKIGEQEPEKSLAMLRDIPQTQAVGADDSGLSDGQETSRARRDSGPGTPIPASAPDSDEIVPEADSTMELSTEHIVTVDDSDVHSEADVSDLDVGPTEICEPEELPGPKEVQKEVAQAKAASEVDNDFSMEPTRVDPSFGAGIEEQGRDGASPMDDDERLDGFEMEPTRVEKPSGLPEAAPVVDDSTPGAASTEPDTHTSPSSNEGTETPPSSAARREMVTPTPDVETSSSVETPPSGIDFEPDDDSKPQKLLLIGGSLGAVALVGAGLIAALVWFGDDDEPPDTDQTGGSAALQEVDEHPPDDESDDPASEAQRRQEVAEPEDEQDEASMVFVDIDSEPSGATVYDDEQPIGETRLESEFEAEEFPERLRLEKEGYEDKIVELDADESQWSVELEAIEIEEDEPTSPEPAAPDPEPASPQEPTTPPSAVEPQQEDEDDDEPADVDSVVDEHLFP